MLTKILSTSIIIGIFLIGCGGTTTDTSGENLASMPHQVDMTPKTSREFDPEGEEYLKFMKTYLLNSRVFRAEPSENGNWITLLNDQQHRKRDKNYVFYYDTDHDKSTGYYDKWVPGAGADYLYEDGVIYKYTGTPGSHEWSWQFYRDAKVENLPSPSHKMQFNKALIYGVMLNQDWSFNKFLGYFDTKILVDDYYRNWEEKFFFAENKDRVVTVHQNYTYANGIYFHSYRRDRQKLNPNELFYTYEFYSNFNHTIKYTIEGNLLINSEGIVLSDDLQYEVRDYDVVTIMPREVSERYNIHIFKIEKMTIRDNNWNKVLSLTHNSSPTYQVNKEELERMIQHHDDVTKVDVSNITNMDFLFGTTHFNQDISGWNVSNVTSMRNMFAGAWSFNQDISGWDVSNVTDMFNMLYDTEFNQDISGWDVSKVTNHYRFGEQSPLEDRYKPHFR